MDRSRVTFKNIVSALVGVFLAGAGVALNNNARLGNDTVGIIYDGIRNVGGLNSQQLGMASNMVNLTLVILLLFIGRRYISLGTVIYFVPYGFCVNAGNYIYEHLAFSDGLAVRIAFSVTGCLMICLGVAIYIAVDIGVDPFTGIVLVIRDKCKVEYRYAKIGFDVVLILIGTILGGKLGVVTVVTAAAIGPVIQFFTGLVKKYWLKE